MQASQQIKSKLFNVSIDATVNPKDFLAIMFFKFDTTEKELLNALLEKYEHEKAASTQFNPNNKIVKCMRGNCCIAVVVPHGSILSNISLLLGYLAKTEIKGETKKYVSGKYSKLMKDIKEVDVKVVGHVKRFVEMLKSDKKDRLDKFANSLDKINIKDRDDPDGDKSYEVGTATVDDIDETSAMYMAIVLADVCCSFSKSSNTLKINFDRPIDAEHFKDIMRIKEKVVFQTQVRSFLTQSGTIGIPSAKDRDKSMFKKKVSNIMNSENALAYIYAKLKGISYKFKDEGELKTTDNEALSTIMKAKFSNK